MTALPDPLSTERLHDPLLPTQSMAPFELPNHGVRVVRDEKSHCVLGFLCFHVPEMSLLQAQRGLPPEIGGKLLKSTRT